MKLYNLFSALGAIALTASLASCSDDVTYDYPGVDGQVVISPTVNSEYTIVKTPVGYQAPSIDWSIEARTRINATEPVVVKFEIDNTLVDSINKANDTEYLAMPDGMVTLEVPALPVEDEGAETSSRAGNPVTLTIPVGTTVSNQKVTAVITNDESKLSTLDLTKEYVVPVRMTEVTSANARLAVSSSNVSYMAFNLVEAMINQDGSPTGTIVPKADRQDWNAVEGGGASEWWGWEYPIIYESDYSYGMYSKGSYVDFDFGKEYTFDGVYAFPYYGSSSYTLFKPGTDLFTSEDGTNWTYLGTSEGYKSTVAFYAPVTTRYLRVQLVQSEGYVAITKFSIYAL